MESSSPEAKIMAVLKQELRARGFQYREIAQRLRVSEGTVKRYFAGKGVTLTVLRKLAEIASLDLLTLAELVQKREAADRKFNKVQAAALAKSQLLSAIYFMLWHGWSPAQISREFDIKGELDRAMEQLETLGVIRRLAHEVKILATPSLNDRGGSQLEELTRHNARLFLTDMDLHDERSSWVCSSARLSRNSAARLQGLITKFIEEASEMMVADTPLPPEETQWYRLFLGAQPISRKRYLEIR